MRVAESLSEDLGFGVRNNRDVNHKNEFWALARTRRLKGTQKPGSKRCEAAMGRGHSARLVNGWEFCVNS